MDLLDYFAAHATQPGVNEICKAANVIYSDGKIWSPEDPKTPLFYSFDKWLASLTLERVMELSSIVKFEEAKAMVKISQFIKKKPSEIKANNNTLATDLEDVFNHWRISMNHPQAQLIDKRKALINKTLKSGYTVIQLKLAIDGHKKSLWHIEKGFDGIEYSLKPENIDKFIKQAGMTDAELNNGKLKWGDWSFTDELQAELGVRSKDYRELS